jgi:hypothetical protein
VLQRPFAEMIARFDKDTESAQLHLLIVLAAVQRV